MKKELNFIPVYKGELNMTSKRASQIEAAREYHKSVSRRRAKIRETRNIILSLIFCIAMVLLVLSLPALI